MSSRQFLRIRTDYDGTFEESFRCIGEIIGVEVEIGTLGSADITIVDEASDTTILAVEGVEADTAYRPQAIQHDTDGEEIVVDDYEPDAPGTIDLYGGVIAYGKLLITVVAASDGVGSLYLEVA